MSSFLPLNAKDDVRALTCSPVIFESAVINSSLIPSLKYSSFLSALMFTNASTAMDFAAASLCSPRRSCSEADRGAAVPREVETLDELTACFPDCWANHQPPATRARTIALTQIQLEVGNES